MDSYTINISWSVIDDSRSINYKNIMIVNDRFTVTRITPLHHSLERHSLMNLEAYNVYNTAHLG
jgi:hypothetical protein